MGQGTSENVVAFPDIQIFPAQSRYIKLSISFRIEHFDCIYLRRCMRKNGHGFDIWILCFDPIHKGIDKLLDKIAVFSDRALNSNLV
jgi:hypothetical protein